MIRPPSGSKSEAATEPDHGSASTPPLVSGELAPIQEQHVPELARFVAIQSGNKTDVEARLRWLLLENPAREASVPLGWGLRSSGALVGCILYVPQHFRYQQRTVLMMGSSSFYVDERYRGSGGLIFLKFSELARKWPLFGNSANAGAAYLWKARGAIPVPFSDHELFGVVRWGPLIEESVARRTHQNGFARAVSGPLSHLVAACKRLKVDINDSGNLTPLTSPEQVAELLIDKPSDILTAVRDLKYLRWRYFSGPDASTRVFAYHDRRSDIPILIAVNQRLRGYGQQIRTLNVLDAYPVLSPEANAAMVGALLHRYRDQIDALVLRGFTSTWPEMFRSLGFVYRRFDAPSGWLLDKSKLLPTRDWYIVPADGDLMI